MTQHAPSRHPRKYSLFEKRPEGWVRISNLALPKQTAVSFFQNALLAYAFGTAEYERRLKVVKDDR